MKKKILNTLIEIIFFALIFILILSLVLNKTINSLDEIWNYYNSHTILMGLMPYKDISLITIPLFQWTSAIFLKIFGDHLIVFRVEETIMISTIFFMTYKILLELQRDRIFSILASLFMITLYGSYIACDYNFLSLLLILIIVLMELKQINKNEKIILNKIDIIEGMVAGLVVCTKQSIGLFTCITILIEPFLLIYDSKEKNIALKKTIYRLIGIASVGTIFIVYLSLTKSFNDFVNYAILGIRTFKNKIEYKSLLQSEFTLIRVLSVIMPIYIITTIIALIIFKSKISKDKKLSKYKEFVSKNICLIAMEFGMAIVVYPISDVQHFLLSIFILIMQFWGVMGFTINTLEQKKIIVSAEIAIIVLIFCNLTKSIYINLKEYINKDKINGLKHYEYIINDNDIEENIKIRTQYILSKEEEGYNVRFIDASVAIFRIPLDEYEKNYDIPIIGNIGKDGEDGMITEIEKSHNTVYIILNDKSEKNWQTLLNVIDYIKEHCKKLESFCEYDVYYKE